MLLSAGRCCVALLLLSLPLPVVPVLHPCRFVDIM
jgi:hypothetical protein